ncbi:MAG: FtsX-like permease family protein [bacterium]|nr:FtsX-like permease family protein [bacterium]
MFKSYYKIAFRTFQRQKFYSFINITGLALGLACVIILILWIKNEFSYDRYHDNSERIYRVTSKYEVDGKIRKFVSTPSPLAPVLAEKIPGVSDYVRFGGMGSVEVIYQDKRFFEDVALADPGIFRIFTWPLITGNPETILQDPRSLLISEEMKAKYFGENEAVGKVLSFYGDRDYRIAGIFRNIPENSHFRFDFLASFAPVAKRRINDWGISNYSTYILTTDEFDPGKYADLIPGIIEEYEGSDARYVYKSEYPLQKLTDIHLYSNLDGDSETNISITNIYIFTAIALFILFVACFNYVNLSTAKYTSRTKEVGIRKVLGSTRSQLIRQFLSESILFTLIALILAVALVELTLPTFNSLAHKNLDINYSGNIVFLMQILALGIGVGLFSGSYPAFLLSNFQPVKIIRGMIQTHTRGVFLKKSLVVIQFSISIMFIVGTIILYDQLDFIYNKDLGMNKEQIVNITINDKNILDKIPVIKSEFKKHPDIISVSATSYSPVSSIGHQNYWYEGLGDQMYPAMNWISVDSDFIETYGLELISGRDFSSEIPSDIERAYILSESAVKEVGWDDPLGQPFRIPEKGVVIGVVKDFHFKSLREKIGPIALNIWPSWYNFISVKINTRNISETMDHIRDRWKEFSPRMTFEYSFLDEDFGKLYESDKILSRIFTYAAGLAIIIAILGLFGLVAFEAQQRNKEIGIRKVLGADILKILMLFWREFFQWIVIANVFAWPIVYITMSGWLQNFAYRINIGWSPFISGALSVLVISIITISLQASKAAMKNPVDTLKYE